MGNALNFVKSNWKIGIAILGGIALVGLAKAVANKCGDDDEYYDEENHYLETTIVEALEESSSN